MNAKIKTEFKSARSAQIAVTKCEKAISEAQSKCSDAWENCRRNGFTDENNAARAAASELVETAESALFATYRAARAAGFYPRSRTVDYRDWRAAVGPNND
jgi:hypothetical protein